MASKNGRRRDHNYVELPRYEECALTYKAGFSGLNTDQDEFEGYASVYGVRDAQGDCIEKGSFINLAAYNASGDKIFWDHDYGTEVGSLISAKEDSKGLLVRGRWGTDIVSQYYKNLVARWAQAGITTGMSIGFLCTPGDYDYRGKSDDGKVSRMLRRVTLREVSLVPRPANRQALLHLYPATLEGQEYMNLSDALRVLELETKVGRDLEKKVGKTHSAATVAKLKAIKAVLDEMLGCDDPDDDDTETSSATTPNRRAGGNVIPGQGAATGPGMAREVAAAAKQLRIATENAKRAPFAGPNFDVISFQLAEWDARKKLNEAKHAAALNNVRNHYPRGFAG
jgi:HK97 family phage prohead protease